MKRSRVSKTGKSTVSKVKKNIQSLVRDRALERDGGCILRNYTRKLPSSYAECGPYRTDGELILQADHLVTRANSVSYADLDNIVILCQRHHFYFKKQHSALFWQLVYRHIGEERTQKVIAWEADHTPHRMYLKDWMDIAESLETH